MAWRPCWKMVAISNFWLARVLFFKKSKEYLSKSNACITIWKIPLLLVSCLLDYCSFCFVWWRDILSQKSFRTPKQSKLTHGTCLAIITTIVTIFKATNQTLSDISRKNTFLGWNVIKCHWIDLKQLKVTSSNRKNNNFFMNEGITQTPNKFSFKL